MNLSYSTAILQDRAWRLWAAEQLVLIAWLPVWTRGQILCQCSHNTPLMSITWECPLSKRSGDSARALIPSSPRARLPLANHMFLRGLEGWVQTMCISKWECLVTSSWGSCTHRFSSSVLHLRHPWRCMSAKTKQCPVSSINEVTQVNQWITALEQRQDRNCAFQTGIMCFGELFIPSGLIRNHCLGFTPWKTQQVKQVKLYPPK